MFKRRIFETLQKYKTYGIFIVAVFIAGVGLLAYLAKPIIDFEQCVAERGLVWTSYPSKCYTPDGRVLVSPFILDGVELITNYLRD